MTHSSRDQKGPLQAQSQTGNVSTVKQVKDVGLIKTMITPGVSKEPDECFKPFIFYGFVLLTGLVEDQWRVKKLRDTGGLQSFILSDLLPLSSETSCKAS